MRPSGFLTQAMIKTVLGKITGDRFSVDIIEIRCRRCNQWAPLYAGPSDAQKRRGMADFAARHLAKCYGGNNEKNN